MTPKRWLDPTPIDVPDAVRAACGDAPPLVAERLARRGILTAEAAAAFLDPDRYTPAPPDALPDMARAVERIRQAIQRRETTAVWGDFDVDGQTAAALLVDGLRGLGGGARVVYHIPHRQRDGHGIHLPRLKDLIDGGVSLVVTCDTGVSAHQAVDYAHARGVDVIITDHHHLPETLPDALAVINPRRLPDDHPLRELPGVGCAYKLMEALSSGKEGEGSADRFLDLVALGIVADMATLTGDTRWLLQRGLAALRQTQRRGLRALFERAEIDPARITEQHIGFALAPRLNALGRLGDANPAVELLTSSDRERVSILAVQLEGLNAERKLLTHQVYRGAQAMIEQDTSLLDGDALVLAHPAWSTGVIGIAAARLAEEYNRPVILLSAPPGEPARGSARSVAGVDVTQALRRCAHLLDSCGGHTMAAGLSLDAGKIADLRRAFSRAVRDLRGADDAPALRIDACVPLAELSPAFVRGVERLAPFGAGNPQPVLLARAVKIRRQSAIGRRGEHLRITVEDDSGSAYRVFWWHALDTADLPAGAFDLAYTVRTSDDDRLMIEWVGARPLDDSAGVIDVAAPTIAVVDHRRAADPAAELMKVMDANLAVWGVEVPQFKSRPVPVGAKHASPPPETSPSEDEPDSFSEGEGQRALAVWTAPPGPAEWRAVLARVQPETVYLFALDPGLDTLEPFIRRLAGLVKYAIHHKGGLVSAGELAAATAHRAITVRAGLDWLAARGSIALEAAEGDILRVTASPAPPAAASNGGEAERLRALLAETAAYRAYFRTASAEALVYA